jgi:hypothetical protein
MILMNSLAQRTEKAWAQDSFHARLSIREITPCNLKCCTEPYPSMISYLRMFALGDASGAVGFTAAVGRLANALQPIKRSIVLPRLSAILINSGLRQDAAQLITALPEKELQQ